MSTAYLIQKMCVRCDCNHRICGPQARLNVQTCHFLGHAPSMTVLEILKWTDRHNLPACMCVKGRLMPASHFHGCPPLRGSVLKAQGSLPSLPYCPLPRSCVQRSLSCLQFRKQIPINKRPCCNILGWTPGWQRNGRRTKQPAFPAQCSTSNTSSTDTTH